MPSPVVDKSRLSGSRFDGLYGLELVDCSADEVRGRVPVRPDLTQPTGVVHGGVFASIAEALASAGTNCGVFDAGSVGLGMANDTRFLRPGDDGALHGVARRVHASARTWLWDVEIRDDAGALLAISRVTVAVRRV
jgi:1,4-dihydroxy-2-naphthoyl-CoA hydrolase